MTVGTLAVRRPRHIGRDMFRAYELAARSSDVLRVIQIKSGATAKLELPVGTYLVQATISWCASPILLVEIAEGEHIELSCTPNLSRHELPIRGSEFANDYIRLTVDSP